MKVNQRNLIAAILITILMLAVLFISLASAATSGLKNAGLGEDISGIGTVAWGTPDGITTAGSPFATMSVAAQATTHYLRGRNYGFSIPDGVFVNGIVVSISRESSGQVYPVMQDYEVKLVKNGVITGDNKAKIGINWPTSGLGTVTYGSPTDLWGTTWTPSEINGQYFGVVLSAINPRADLSRTATVDTIQISVYYSLENTTTGVDCGNGNPVVTYGDSITCVAAVTRTTGVNTPTGLVSWATSRSGIFTTSPCALSGSNGISECSVSFAPTTIGLGFHRITATYQGDENFFGSISPELILTVNKRPVTVTADSLSKVYGEVDPELTYHITSGNLVYNDVFTGTLTRVAGETASIYQIQQGTLALPNTYILTYLPGTFTILKATPTLSITNSPVLYNGSPRTATVVGSVTGTVSDIKYNGSSIAPTNVGTYAVTADFIPNDATNYNSLSDAPAGNFVISLTPVTYKLFLSLITR